MYTHALQWNAGVKGLQQHGFATAMSRVLADQQVMTFDCWTCSKGLGQLTGHETKLCMCNCSSIEVEP